MFQMKSVRQWQSVEEKPPSTEMAEQDEAQFQAAMPSIQELLVQPELLDALNGAIVTRQQKKKLFLISDWNI